jgi:DNA mismatch repair protein MutS2
MVKRSPVEALEFDRVLDIVSTYAHSEAARLAVAALRPLGSVEDIAGRASTVQEIRRLIEEQAPLGFARYEDITGAVERAVIEGAVLEAVDIRAFVPPLEIMSAVFALIASRRDLPRLEGLAARMPGFPGLLESIVRSIDGEGRILDEASHLLYDIRTRLRALEKKISRRLEEITRDPAVGAFLQDGFITRRSGRWVIPVRMDSKGMVKGVVHDVSRSGETAFMEPLEIIGVSNEFENLVAEEKAEEIRILKNLTRLVRDGAGELKEQFEALVSLDVLNGIAGFSELLGAEVPLINEASAVSLVNARHPLLLLHERSERGFGAVPLDLSVGEPDRVMVITGPNAGGKTIAIKTVGLLLLMALSGMPVPADSSSSFPLVGDVLVDIGDEQSIEENLSTFSAHVSNISAILGRAGRDTLVLMDELGTGTDPGQGAAIGSAVLRDLSEKGALVLATTHLIDVVGFVHRSEGMANASMEFDADTMSPLYRLRAGEPGESHAFEVAERFGLPRRVIEFARGLAGTLQSEFHSLLSELKEKRREHAEALEALKNERAELMERSEALKEKLRFAGEEKQAVMERAYREARGVVSDVRRKALEILEKAKQQKSRTALKGLDRAGEEIDGKLREFRKEPSLSIEDIEEGGTVFVPGIGYDAEVMVVDRKRGRLRVKAADKELELPVAGVGPARGKKQEPGVRLDIDVSEEPVSAELNLIGLRVDEALSRLEPFLNRASLSGIGEVAVVHGVGTGTLRRAVREHLAGHPLVEGVRDGEQYEGGAGVTVVRLS